MKEQGYKNKGETTKNKDKRARIKDQRIRNKDHKKRDTIVSLFFIFYIKDLTLDSGLKTLDYNHLSFLM